MLREEYDKELRVDDFGDTYFVTNDNVKKYVSNLQRSQSSSNQNLRGKSNEVLDLILVKGGNVITTD